MSYKVRNWERFQHYRDRNPPWIKLHFELLSSRDWVALDDASRVLAIACMLVASRNDGMIPDDLDYLRRVAYLNSKPNLTPLIACGFLELLADASNPLACARPETETETETETEGETEVEVGGDPPRTPHAPHAQILQQWNSLAAELGYAPAAEMTPKRQSALRARFRSKAWRDTYEQAFVALRATQPPFLAGQSERGWIANIDWFLKPDTVTKILEGRYIDRQKTVDLYKGSIPEGLE